MEKEIFIDHCEVCGEELKEGETLSEHKPNCIRSEYEYEDGEDDKRNES